MNATTVQVAAGCPTARPCPSPRQTQGRTPEDALRSAQTALVTSEQVCDVASRRGFRLRQAPGPDEQAGLTAKLLAWLHEKGLIRGCVTLALCREGTALLVADWQRNKLYAVRLHGGHAAACWRKLCGKLDVLLSTWVNMSSQQWPPRVGPSNDPAAACTARAVQWVVWLLGFSPDKCRATYRELGAVPPAPKP